jgi:ferredoxin
VCPSGALTYATPRPNELGTRIRTMLATYARAGGRDAALLIHSEEAGAGAIEALGRGARIDRTLHGVPARVLPLEVRHTASVGIDLWLAAIAYGAAQVWVLVTHEEAPAYREAIAAQMAVAQAILSGLGFAGEHFRIVGAGEVSRSNEREPLSGPAPACPRCRRSAFGRRSGAASLRCCAAPAGSDDGSSRRDVRRPARQADDARPRLRAPAARSADAGRRRRAAGAGRSAEPVRRDRRRQEHLHVVPGVRRRLPGRRARRPSRLAALSFIEKNCVQCGLCASTCPENAITLVPRLLLADGGKARRQPRVLNEAEPFRCVRCAKPFGTLRAIESMVAKLSGHSMFQGRAAERLQMCGDCRVIDLHTDPGEVRITEL